MQRHVLLVDDDVALLEVLATVLDLEDLDVSTAADGPAALAAVVERRPDVVVCDVAMPGLDGLEVCRRLKSDPATASLPVILLTAHGGERDRAAGLAAGCDAYLTKPFSPLQLIGLIRSVDPGRPARALGSTRSSGAASEPTGEGRA